MRASTRATRWHTGLAGRPPARSAAVRSDPSPSSIRRSTEDGWTWCRGTAGVVRRTGAGDLQRPELVGEMGAGRTSQRVNAGERVFLNAAQWKPTREDARVRHTIRCGAAGSAAHSTHHVDPDIRYAQVSQLGRRTVDILAGARTDHSSADENAAPYGLSDIAERAVVAAPATGDGIMLVGTDRVVACGQAHSAPLESLPQ